MLASSFCASRPRDVTRRMSTTEVVCAAPSHLRRSSTNTYIYITTSSTQPVVFVASLLEDEVLPAAPRGGTRRYLEGGCELRAASAPSQEQEEELRRSSRSRRRQCPATMTHERSTGQKTSLGSPSNYLPPGRDKDRRQTFFHSN